MIHGGLSPKNILIENGTNAVGFVDLETSCIGSRYFDIGFSLGHLMLHGLDKGADIQQIYAIYMDTYKKGNPAIQINDDMVRRVCLTTMLYRLRHPEARYTLDTFDEAAVVNFTDYAVAEIKSTALK